MRIKSFYINNVLYTIKEVKQKELMDYKCNEEDSYYYGQTHYPEQEIWIDIDLSFEKKKETLYHELMHCYIKEFISTIELEPTEEMLCDISAKSHDFIHGIVKKYFDIKEN